jgi:hypothetical protein
MKADRNEYKEWSAAPMHKRTAIKSQGLTFGKVLCYAGIVLSLVAIVSYL